MNKSLSLELTVHKVPSQVDKTGYAVHLVYKSGGTLTINAETEAMALQSYREFGTFDSVVAARMYKDGQFYYTIR